MTAFTALLCGLQPHHILDQSKPTPATMEWSRRDSGAHGERARRTGEYAREDDRQQARASVARSEAHVRAVNGYTFEVQDLTAPFAISMWHAFRLQLYCDANRGRVKELLEQAISAKGDTLSKPSSNAASAPTHIARMFESSGLVLT
ncbi:hypothetical protein PybrP1_007999 [[Pythium] brassicae (nom. inval.)]|nr:hypothetical protein PybrP1_007999 [[Pythium] brassicae (nom. inval.)]